LQQHPEWAKVHVNLGDALRRLREFEEAAACYRRALELDPARPAVYESLGNALGEQGKLEEAIACFRRALEIQPEFADAHNNLGNALKDQGRLTEAVACFHRALTLEPDHQTAHTNLLLSQHYDATSTLESIAQAHARWNQSLPAPLRAEHSWPDVDRAPNRRLRLGFVSPDLGGHPVGYFLLEVLKSLDRDDAATICYSDRVMGDDMTAELRGMAGLWRDVPWLSDGELAAQIRADRIDVLFDLAGHTGGNRLLVFARKPAPIQITWMGYVGTTGLSEMDYLLADRYEVPEEYAQHYHEAVLWMPDDYVCYAPPPDAPPVGPLPSDDRGSITFASFNNPAKIGPPVVRTWATILRQVPNSRLLLKYLGFGDHGTQQYFHNLFRGEGIDPDRVELLGWSRHRELLQSYHRVDIGLDPFPYCGGLTTCEALWMGVPVVTCPGVTFASRHGLSHLSNVGLTETIACDLEQYAALAVALARDRPRLAALRAGLRPQMAASPLCNGPRFATHLMKLLRGVWQQWIAT
jgi:predicted O-linked N-acetylglucosamine transferase (SPINDLY family)